MTDEEDIGLVVMSKEEEVWNKQLETSKLIVKRMEDALIVEREILKLAESKLAYLKE